MKSLYRQVEEFKKKYPKTVTWSCLKKHCEVIEKHLNPGEEEQQQMLKTNQVDVHFFVQQKRKLKLKLVSLNL